MREEWLSPGAMVPVDVETTAALVTEIKRLIDVVGGMALAQLEQEPRPLEQDYTSLAAYTRALEEYCDVLARVEQEPVACIWEKNDGYKSLEWGGLDANEIQEIGLKSYTPLYTHPPQRTWVGIEQSDMPSDPDPMYDHEYFIAGMVYANYVLKEKNHV